MERHLRYLPGKVPKLKKEREGGQEEEKEREAMCVERKERREAERNGKKQCNYSRVFITVCILYV